MNRKYITTFIVIAFFLSPLVLNSYWVDVLNNIGIYAILALSLNFILGDTGLFHMGHAAFFCNWCIYYGHFKHHVSHPNHFF